MKISDAQSLIKELEGKDYDIVITYQDDLPKEKLDELIAQAKLKFIELTERTRLKSTGVHSTPQNVIRPKRKRIVR